MPLFLRRRLMEAFKDNIDGNALRRGRRRH